MLSKEFQVIENKAILQFITDLKQNNPVNDISLQDYFVTAQEHFHNKFGDDSMDRYIFFIFMNHYINVVKNSNTFNLTLLDNYIDTFKDLNKSLFYNDTVVFYNIVRYYGDQKNNVRTKDELIDCMLDEYYSRVDYTSPIMVYWLESTLLEAMSLSVDNRLEDITTIYNNNQSTVFTYNQIVTKLKGVGEVLWQ